MSLQDQISNDLKAAFKGGDRFVSDVLKMLRAAIVNQEIASNKRETGLSDEELEALIQREVKKRREAAHIYQQSGRSDLATMETSESDVLQRYLPKPLTEDEIKVLIQQVLSDTKLEPIAKNRGIIIGAVKKRAGSAADGSVIAKLVSAVLV
ncbi:MAG: GatB/YqeY domain-containing protein [Candidatus Saccharibacteria bacterium]|nr:GatB/YqeY domain-containing protein [Candidatus Saccharibacteria bacterium]